MAQARGKERMGKKPLFLAHFLDWQAFASPGNEMPVCALLALEIKRGLCLLFGRQGDKEVAGRLRHFEGGVVRLKRRCGQAKGQGE